MKRNFKEGASGSFPIEQQIGSIFRGIVSTLPPELTAMRVKPLKNSTFCKGLIHIYTKEDVKRMGVDKRLPVNPVESYAFYVDDLQTSRLDSVAIYGDNASAKYFALKRRGVLFGYKIIGLKLETGRRPFVDVKLSV